MNMNTKRIELLAKEIEKQLKDTKEGHCARVDFLERDEAAALCHYLYETSVSEDIAFRVLITRNSSNQREVISLTTDEAIEIRNRKYGRLCLFVPSDLVDAAYSSLANSFALIDGRKLQESALRYIRRILPDDAQKVLQTVTRGRLQASYDQRLDFALAAQELAQHGELAKLGLELWRVGLIADASPDFVENLKSNQVSTTELAHPSRISAMARERIQSLKVDKATAKALGLFFRGRSMNNVLAWSRELASEQLTFDRWVFPDRDRSNIRSVTVQPFVNSNGVVEKFCKLEQPDGKDGYLKASCGSKRTMVVKWKCDPPQPDNLSSWNIRILPSDEMNENELDEESDFVEPSIPRVPGHRRSVTVKLDIEKEEIPTCPVKIRVTPLDVAGNEINNNDDGMLDSNVSLEFFMSQETEPALSRQGREKRITVPTIAYGQLEIAMSIHENTLEDVRTEWSEKEIHYFSLFFPGRGMLTIGLSKMLIELEKQIRDEPRQKASYVLSRDEVLPVTVDDCVSFPLQIDQPEMWSAFLKARETFFSRLKKSSPRDLIETADWTPELAGVALRYAQSYRELLDSLVSNGCERAEILQALSLDTLLVRVSGGGNSLEEALVILPTHPFRVAWYANYTQLLRNWEGQLLKYSARKRKSAIDMQALRLLEPINIPAFLYHPVSDESFVFFQNLNFFHGITLPAGVGDPHRRFNDIAVILGLGYEQATMGDIRPHQLKDHLKRFHSMHQYVKTLVSTLINPDSGTFFGEAVQQFLGEQNTVEEMQEEFPLSTFQVHAFVQDEHKRALNALTEVRQQIEQQNLGASDYLLPAFSTSVYPLSQLEQAQPPEAHIAIVTDFTQPKVAYRPISQDSSNVTSGNALYGLITRFVSYFTADEDGLHWVHRIIPESVKKIEHPAGNRYNEILTDLHDAYLDACGYFATQQPDVRPILEVRLDRERRDLLERLHANTNWVVTLDRFFTLDYYDSPHHHSLDSVARKYVLDYAPETIEGLGHRMMVTTAWHEEIETLLGQAMKDLGFANIEQSVSRLLHYLKTVSGRLALQALESPTSAAAAVGLGTVTAWLERKGYLRQAVLVPVDSYPRLFSQEGTGRPLRGERRCDMVLISFRRNIFDATFIEVKWRRDQIQLLQGLAEDMALQMEGSAQAMKLRFFDKERIDDALQRAYLANVIRFYFERSRRYKLFDPAAEQTFIEQLAKLEKSGMEFRPNYEGYIVSLEGERRKPLFIETQTERAKIHVLTAQDLDEATEFSPMQMYSVQSMEQVSIEVEEDQLSNTSIEEDDSESSPVGELSTTERDESKSHQDEEFVTHSDNDIAIVEQSFSSVGEIVIPLGETSGEPVEWSPAIAGSPHLFILGIPGQGKSWTITRILKELGEQHVPSLVLDFHGQFADSKSPFVGMIRPLIIDAAQGLPFSPFECTREPGAGGWKAASYALAEIFAYVTKMGQMQRDIIYTAIQDAYKARGFADEDAIGLEYPASEEVLKRIRQEEQARHVNNVSARCRPLLEMDLFHPVEQASDLLSSIRAGMVIDLHNLYSEELQLAAGAFVLRKLYRDMFRWGYAERLRLVVVLDEAHRLARDVTLPRIMKEGRKFGIAVVVASQGMNDFHQDILGNAGTKVIFRMNYPDSKRVSGFIRGRQGHDLGDRISQLPVGSAYVQTPDMPYGEIVQIYPLDY
ncbi:MAG TPA: ATP-binding protein [Ktedonobacteraceae bacterium]|nr:ATP-binding protein [Ktedonobacteraceae bacterium]